MYHQILLSTLAKRNPRSVYLFLAINLELNNPVALREATLVYNFGLSEYNRVKGLAI